MYLQACTEVHLGFWERRSQRKAPGSPWMRTNRTTGLVPDCKETPEDLQLASVTRPGLRDNTSCFLKAEGMYCGPLSALEENRQIKRQTVIFWSASGHRHAENKTLKTVGRLCHFFRDVHSGSVVCIFQNDWQASGPECVRKLQSWALGASHAYVEVI